MVFPLMAFLLMARYMKGVRRESMWVSAPIYAVSESN